MKDTTRIRLAQQVATRADLLAKALDVVKDGSNVMGRMRDAQGNLRAKAFDTTRGPMRHDATFAGLGDQAVRDEADLNRAIKAAATEIGKAWAIIARYPPPHRATEADLLALSRNPGHCEPGCENCARTQSPAGGPRWEPPRPGLTQPTFVGNRLERPMLLCEWCYDRVRRWGRLPSVKELEAHHRGEIVPTPPDVKEGR